MQVLAVTAEVGRELYELLDDGLELSLSANNTLTVAAD